MMNATLGDADPTRQIPPGSVVVQLACRSFDTQLTFADISAFVIGLDALEVEPESIVKYIVVDPERRNEAFVVVRRASFTVGREMATVWQFFFY